MPASVSKTKTSPRKTEVLKAVKRLWDARDPAYVDSCSKISDARVTFESGEWCARDKVLMKLVPPYEAVAGMQDFTVKEQQGIKAAFLKKQIDIWRKRLKRAAQQKKAQRIENLKGSLGFDPDEWIVYRDVSDGTNYVAVWADQPEPVTYSAVAGCRAPPDQRVDRLARRST